MFIKKYTANAITLSRLILIPLMFLDLEPITMVVATVILYWGFDELDGTVARKLNITSVSGHKLDLLTDRMLDFALFGYAAYLHPEMTPVIAACLILRHSTDIITLDTYYNHWRKYLVYVVGFKTACYCAMILGFVSGGYIMAAGFAVYFWLTINENF